MEEKFAAWAIVELFGHNKIAGMCSEQNVAGVNMLRVDVPEVDGQPAFTRLLGGSSIYAINPVTKELAEHYASMLKVKPIDVWDVRDFIAKQKIALESKTGRTDGDNYDHDNED